MNNETPILEIKNIDASINDVKILNNLNLKINKGEIHAIMGRNGSGKSTFSKIVAGHPSYEILNGDILFNGESILSLEPDERSHMGIFLAFQYPIEIPGVSNEDFLRLAYNSKMKSQNKEELDPIQFFSHITEKLKIVDMDPTFLARNVNEGFSGGEKKRNEILQMALLDSSLSILDETDSGLDIDALKIISNGINKIMNKDKAIVLITHYQRLLDYIKPDYIHVMQNGKIIKTGNFELAKTITATANAAKLAEAQITGLIEKNDKLAELQRQIRDDETKTFAERIAANNELNDVLDKQEAEMLKLADTRVSAAKLELDTNKDNIELQIAYQQTLNDRAGVEAQRAGFRS